METQFQIHPKRNRKIWIEGEGDDAAPVHCWHQAVDVAAVGAVDL
jgi:hypothetical protein